MRLTASKLYDYIQCPHKVWRDAYGPMDEKILEVNPFVQLLWDRGILHEKETIARLGDYLDLGEGTAEERLEKTLTAMRQKTPLIYQGLLRYENLYGIPDLLKLLPDGSYMPIDIKSGMAMEGIDEEDEESGRPKKHYAVQLCLYVELLHKLGFQNDLIAGIIDIRGEETIYHLTDSVGVRNKISFWDFYEKIKKEAGLLLENSKTNKPAMSGKCKLCPWYLSCKKWCLSADDLTCLFYLGRAKRDVINEDLLIETLSDFLNVDLDEVISRKAKEKKFLSGVGEATLKKAIARALIMKKTKQPIVYEKISFPEVSYELFFDIEDDPTQEFVYLHGVYERSPNGERFLDFTAKENTPEAEKKAWQDFWVYIKSLPQDDFAVYYYSAHEKTTYKKMQKIYPEIISEKEVVDFFDNPRVIDLYKIVLKNTDWPLGSYSLKEIAVYLGFKWRDETPSGALSIEWYNKYLETKDPKHLERILLYNEDDCKATMVIKDGLQKLSS